MALVQNILFIKNIALKAVVTLMLGKFDIKHRVEFNKQPGNGYCRMMRDQKILANNW